MGFGLRIAPGVRISASSRGVRAGIGPRIGRVHVGSGGVGFSTGAGPLTYFTGAGGRSRSSGRSVAAYERQMRAAQRQQELEGVLALENEMVRIGSLHEHDFPLAQPPPPVVADAVEETQIRKRLEQEELQGVPLLRISQRRAARERARGRVDAEVDRERAAKEAHRADAQAALDAAWTLLTTNDRDTVLATMEKAFADNESPAAAIDCVGDRVDLIMRWPELDSVVGERKLAQTPSGKPTHHKRSKTERNRLYTEVMASNVLATVKEAFAVAPGVNSAGLLAVRGAHDPAAGGTVLEPLFCGVFDRSDFDRVEWSRIHPVETIKAAQDAKISIGGRASELRPLDLSGESDLIATVGQLALGLGWRSPYGTPERESIARAPDAEISLDDDVTRLDGLASGCLAALQHLAQRDGNDATLAEPHLFLLLQQEGSPHLAGLGFDTAGDERLADLLSTIEQYRPLAAGYAFPIDSGQMGLFCEDALGATSCRALTFQTDRAVAGEEAPEPDEAEIIREGLERSRKAWGAAG